MAASKARALLTQIEDGAHDPDSDLPTLLRKCIALGGATGSDRLRAWASVELKGYTLDDELPAYRTVVAPLLLDGVSGYNHIRRQAVPANMIPDFAREHVGDVVPFPQPIAEIADLVHSARSRGEPTVQLGPPGGKELVAIINDSLGRLDERRFPGMGDLPPTQIVERIYWEVSISPLQSILDVVRTTLVELVAEMRAGTPDTHSAPSNEVAEQAVDIAIYGKRNRVIVQQAAPGSQVVAAAGGAASLQGTEPESRGRRLMWWLVGAATIVAAVATVWLLFGS